MRAFRSIVLAGALAALAPFAAVAQAPGTGGPGYPADSFFDVFTELSLESKPQPPVDSFFDIFTEVQLPDIQCDPCKALEAEVVEVQLQIEILNMQLGLLDQFLPAVEGAVSSMESELSDLQKQLEEMQNPKNYIESEGRRYDSSDNAALRQRNANLWKAYKGGRMTAQEYSEEIGKPFDDPGVAEDLKILKEIIKQQLEEQIEETQKKLDEAKKARDQFMEQASKWTDELEGLTDALEELMDQLEDCYKRCKEEPVNIPEDYGIDQEMQGIWERIGEAISEFFGGGEEEPDPFAGLDDFLDGLNGQPQPGGAGGEIPTEMLPLDLRGGGQQPVDSFFDVFFEVELPPVVCHLCDPIREQMAEIQSDLNDLLQQQAQAQAEVDAAYRDMQTAQDAKNAAERALDTLNNPPSYAESEGRRYDSSDHAAMQVRNQRLWGAYKSGDLSAQELEGEWGKPFDHPDVQRELEEIKQQMRDDLQETIDDAQEAIDDLNELITDRNETLVDLAGAIAAHRAVLEFLAKDLEECEKRCREPAVPELSNGLFEGWDEFIFPEVPDLGGSGGEEDDREGDWDEEEEAPVRGFMDWLKFGGDDEESSSSAGSSISLFADGFESGNTSAWTGDGDNDGVTDATEEIKVPQECVSPAVPMSRCESTCHTQCTKSGVRAWQEGNTVKIEDCGICPPMEIDLCPSGTYFEKSQCESDNECECEEKARSGKGEPCYGCKEKKKTGFLCNWFGLFCPEEKQEGGMTIGQVADCYDGQGAPGVCNPLDVNGDGAVDIVDLNQHKFSLNGPGGLSYPLTLNGMDGNDTLSTDDLRSFGDCLNQGGPACDGLGIGNPPPGIFGGIPPDALLGTGPGDMGFHMTNGNDVLLRDPVTPNFFGTDGAGGFDGGPGQPPLPPDFFNPPPGGFGDPGGGLLLFDPSGNLIPNPPPLPPSNEQEVVQRLVNEALARLRNVPLGPCEKFVVTIIRQRIGNTTRYIVRVTKVRDDAKCASSSSSASRCDQGTYESMNDCNRECMNTQGCKPTRWSPLGGGCYMCPPGSGEEDGGGCQSDADCDDHDECTQDTCNERGECTNMEIKDCEDDETVECPDIAHESEAACKQVCPEGSCAVESFEGRDCWFCADRTLDCPGNQFPEAACEKVCPSSAGSCVKDRRTGCFTCQKQSSTCDAPTMTESQCKSSCSGRCDVSYEEFDGLKCFKCIPGTTTQLKCDPPTETEAECKKECFGTCSKSYTRSDGVKCFECVSDSVATPAPPSVQKEQCDAPTMEQGACQGSCDGTCEKSYTRGDGVSCYQCKVSTTPQCPSGTTANQSTCQSQCSAQGGNCVLENGCYSCVVLNCPSGTYKNDCPSSCPNGCDVAAQQEGVTCYRCKQSCEDFCAGVGLQVEQDYTSYILGELNKYSCVSGANISVRTASNGSCKCLSQPQITIDTTPPVCRGTPCGDVACGQQASCSGGENTTITVTCNWGGWRQLDEFRFQPVVGAQ